MEFWLLVQNEYRNLTSKAFRVFISFATLYWSEAEFWAIAVIENKYRSKIIVEHEMRVAVSNLIPRFEKLCGEHPAYPSYSFD